MHYFLIVYPQERWVSAKEIARRYDDAVLNNELCRDVAGGDTTGMLQALENIGQVAWSGATKEETK